MMLHERRTATKGMFCTIKCFISAQNGFCMWAAEGAGEAGGLGGWGVGRAIRSCLPIPLHPIRTFVSMLAICVFVHFLLFLRSAFLAFLAFLMLHI